jgi:hypothetical protein
MANKIQIGLMALLITALVGLTSSAGNQGNPLEKIVKDIADDIKAGNMEAARKKAIAAARNIEEPNGLMELFKKKGLGVGPKLEGLAKVPNAKTASEISHLAAAMAELTRAKVPTKDGPGVKTKKAWIAEADNLQKASLDLAKAAAKNDAKGMKAAAEKANTACINCHSKFK